MKRWLLSCLFASALCAVDFNDPKSVHDQDFFLSFWRSGTNWLFTCIQGIARKPVRYIVKNSEENYCSNACTNHLRKAIDYTKKPLFQTHSCGFINRFSHNDNRLLLIIRNYKEAILRHFEDNIEAFSQGIDDETFFDYYAEYLAVYDAWDPAMRHLVYYEDLLQNPRSTLKKVLRFLGESTERLDDFMANFERYKIKTIASYHRQYKKEGGSMSKGSDLLYHSNKTPKELLIRADDLMQTKYSSLFDHYLQRYQER